MLSSQQQLKVKKPFFIIYLSTFLFGLHLALPNYVNSSFLNQFFGESSLGLVYVLGSFLTLLALSIYPRILTRLGNYRVIMAVLALQIALLATLALTTAALWIVLLFVAIQVLMTLGLFNLDVFLETYTEEKVTGTVRSIMLTAINVAILLGPLFAGLLLTDSDYWKIYLVAAAMLVPVLFLIAFRFRNFKDQNYDHTPLLERLKQVLRAGHPNDSMRHVVIANLLMRFFYSWMVIYAPIYLHQHIGFSWAEIGVILPIMLLPFILFEYPLGRMMDTRANERLVMTLGFFIAALFTASLSFAHEASLVLWATQLFGTRVGISFVEIASESYFFKQIEGKDTNLLSIFRDARPLAWIAGPLSASLLLFIIDIRYLFIILAGILLFGVWNSLQIRTKS